MISLKMKTREKLFLLVNFERSVEKNDFFQKEEDIKINGIFKNSFDSV